MDQLGSQQNADQFADEESRESFDLVGLIGTIWERRKAIVIFVLAATILTALVSLILPEKFRSAAVILPDTDKSRTSSIGALADLASLAGMSVGGEAPFVKLYPTVIMSEMVLKNVIVKQYQTKKFSAPVTLIQYWEIEKSTPEESFESALGYLRKELDIAIDNKLNVVTISLAEREPQLASDIVTEITKELDAFIRTKRTTSAGQQRKFVEGRLQEIERDLRQSEEAVKDFREKNRVVNGSPQLMLQQERLMREAQINATLYTELKKQFEIVKIEEVKDVPVVSILDPARPAAQRESPRRRVMVLTMFVLSLVGALCFVVLDKQYGASIRSTVKALSGLRTAKKRA